VGGVIPKEFIPSGRVRRPPDCNDGREVRLPSHQRARSRSPTARYHDVDSSARSRSSRPACLALHEAVRAGPGPQLLEPIMKVVVTVPNDYLGNVTGDMISSRRGMIHRHRRPRPRQARAPARCPAARTVRLHHQRSAA
jgi:elongation factor G